jgi:fatty acid desaturase
MKVHSSDLDRERLRRLLADEVERDQASGIRRYFLVRVGLIAAVIWVFSWPIPLLPHTLLWGLAAAVVFACGLMSPPRRQQSTPDTAPKPSHRE